MRLRPKPKDFERFASLERHVDLICEATQLLNVVMQSDTAQLEFFTEQIHDLRRRGNQILRAEIKGLDHKTKAPFFENREDFYRIFSRLDDVLESISATAGRLLAYRIDRAPSDLLGLAEIVRTCGDALRAGLEVANKDGLLVHSIGEIYQLREQAAQMVQKGLTELFANEKDPSRLLKVKEIYDRLESSVNQFKEVARAVEDSVVKHRDRVPDLRVS